MLNVVQMEFKTNNPMYITPIGSLNCKIIFDVQMKAFHVRKIKKPEATTSGLKQCCYIRRNHAPVLTFIS